MGSNKAVQNANLFVAVHQGNETRIRKHLDLGADVNANDPYDDANTPLHVAVLKGKPKIIEVLLENGAEMIENSGGKYPIDLATQDIPNAEEIIKILKARDNKKSTAYNIGESVLTKHEIRDPHQTKAEADVERKCFEKDSGTSSIEGQLYETKLLSLVLYRACKNPQIKHFFMASNIKGLTPFDDVVFKFNTTEHQKPCIVFIQAKHRINPSKNNFTVTDVFNENNHDFYIYRYWKTYTNIKQKFNNTQFITDDPLFKYQFNGVDCYFIIYTPSIQKFEKKNDKTGFNKNVNDLIKTSEMGKIFQLHDDDKKRFVKILHEERAIKPLAERLANFLKGAGNKYSYAKMMRDDLIRKYHIVLANEVFEIEKDITDDDNATKTSEITGDSKDNIQNLSEIKANEYKTGNQTSTKAQKASSKIETRKNIYRKSKFRQDFLDNNNDDNLSLLRKVLFEELQLQPTDNPVFKLPVEFGNVDINECKVDKITKKVGELLDEADENNATLTLRPDKLTGEIINNMLVLKADGNVFEFAKDITLAQNAKKVAKYLNNKDLSKYTFKFDRNIFPRFSIDASETELKTYNNEADDFFSKLWYHTDQDQEHEIEKKMISNLEVECKSNKLNNEVPFYISSKLLFLEYHEKVQKWWMSKEKTLDYLTKSCTFLNEAVKHVEGNPLTFILSSIYVKENRIDNIKFKHQAVKNLALNQFTEHIDQKKLLIILTDDNALSAAKVLQYFEHVRLNFIFLDLKWMTVPFADLILSDLKQSNVYNLVIVCEQLEDEHKLRELIKSIVHVANIVKIIILTDNCSVAKQEDYFQIITEKKDVHNSFTDICDDLQDQILDRYVIFQGALVTVRNVINEDLKCHLKANILRKLIDGTILEIGNILTDNKYDDTRRRCYISRKLMRCLKIKDEFIENENKLNEEKLKIHNLIVSYNGQISNVPGDDLNNDIIIICNSNDHLRFLESTLYNTILNIHYFQKRGIDFIWIKSVGNLTYLYNCVESISEDELQSPKEHTYEPKSLTDIDEKMILITAGPGMGKCTLLTHLSLETNNSSHDFWIVRVNLQCHSHEFKNLTISKFNESIVLDLLKRIAIQCKTKSDKGMGNKEIETLDMFFFDNYYQKGKLVVLCDGFHNMIPDYEEEVIAFLLMLNKTKIKHIWVTARPQMIQTLEKALDLFSYLLMRFDDKDLELYFERVNLRVPKDIKDTEFLRTPQHLYMYSEVILDEIKKRVNTIAKIPLFVFKMPDIYTMFVKFVEMKFKSRPEFEDDYFGSKHNIDTISAKTALERERSKFLKDHKTMAAHAICKELLSEQDLRKQEHDLHKIINRTLNDKSSLIEIINGSVRFVHFTYAEYFFSEFLCDRLVSESCDQGKLWDFLINKFLIQEKYAYARGFINWKFRNDKKLATLWSNSEHAENVYDFLMKHVNDRKGQVDDEKSLIFDVAFDEKLHNVLIFLLNCNKHNRGGYTWLLNLTYNTYNTCHYSDTMNNVTISVEIKKFVRQLLGIEAPDATTPDPMFKNLLTAMAPIEEIFEIITSSAKEIYLEVLKRGRPEKHLRYIQEVSRLVCPFTGKYIIGHSIKHDDYILRRRDSTGNVNEIERKVNGTRRKSYPTAAFDDGQYHSYENDVRSRLRSLF